MAERKTGDELAALERARVQIEIALGANEDWAAFRQAGSSRLLAERALAGNPLYRAWELLNQAIQDLYAKSAPKQDVQPGTAPDDLTRIRRIGPALAQRLAERGITSYGQIAAWRSNDVRDVAEALGLGRTISRQNWIEQAAVLELRRSAGTTVPPADGARTSSAPANTPRIELDHILAHIRDNAALRGDPPPISRAYRDEASDAAPAAGVELVAQRLLEPVVPPSPHASADAVEPRQQGEQEGRDGVEGGPASEAVGTFRSEPGEAAVMFVIREREDAGSIDDGSEGAQQPGPPLSNRTPAGEAEDAAYDPSAVEPEEAEVEIVSRSADRRSISATAPSRR